MFFKINSSNVNVYASRLENIIENELSNLGYKRKTTFISDFGIAEWCGGCDAVKDTYNNAFNGWKNDIEYMTEFVMVLNHLCWYHYYISKKFDKKYPYNLKLSELYGKLYEKADEYVMEHFKGDDLHYYISTTD